MKKIEVDILKSSYYAKLANYDDLNKANNKIIVANATKIKDNMERKEKLVSNLVQPLNNLNKDGYKIKDNVYESLGNDENDL